LKAPIFFSSAPTFLEIYEKEGDVIMVAEDCKYCKFWVTTDGNHGVCTNTENPMTSEKYILNTIFDWGCKMFSLKLD
jgi:hypothetical protein